MPDDKLSPDDPAQSQRFIDMAREVGADDGAAAFDGLFGAVVEQPKVIDPTPSQRRKKTIDTKR